MNKLLSDIQALGNYEGQAAFAPLNADEMMDIKGGNGPISDGVYYFTHCLIYHTFQSFYQCIQEH